MTTFEPIQQAEYINLDLFPAKIFRDSDLLYKDCRVIATDSHYYVFHEGSSGPETTSQGPLTAFSGGNVSGWLLSTPEGILTVLKDANCGCGSRLRSFYPFPGVSQAPHYPETSTP